MKKQKDSETTKTEISPEDRVPTGMKIGYGIGDFGANLVFLATLFYVLYYFTDVLGIPPATAGIIVLASKIWDASIDPVMGNVSDRTRSRWGRKRPYLLFGAVPVGIAVFLLFYTPDFSKLAPSVVDYRIVWALITYILFCTAIAIVNVPYAALTAAMTRDSHERAVITGYRMTFGIIGTLVAAGATLPLVGVFGHGDPVIGFRAVGLIYGALIALATLVAFLATKERVGTLEEESHKTPTKETIHAVLNNRPFLLLLFATLMFMIGMNTVAAVVTYYFKYNLHAEKLVAVANLCIFIPALLSLPLFVFIGKKLSKKFAYNLGMGIVAAMLLLIFFFGERSLALTFAFPRGGGDRALHQLALSLGHHTGYGGVFRVEARDSPGGDPLRDILFRVQVRGGGGGIPGGKGAGADGIRRQPGADGAALMGIRSLLTIFPLVFMVAGIVILSFFPIDAAMHRHMIEEIKAKKGVARTESADL